MAALLAVVAALGAVVVIVRSDGMESVDAATDIESVLALARSAGVITRFSYEPPSLSDIFQEAVST